MQQITLALEEVMNKSLDYEDFVDVHYDTAGEVSMLAANTILMNRIASEAAAAAPGEYRHACRRRHRFAAWFGAGFRRVFRQGAAHAF